MLDLKHIATRVPDAPAITEARTTELWYRGHQIECVELGDHAGLFVDDLQVPVAAVGPGLYHAWLVPRATGSLELLAKCFVDLYFGGVRGPSDDDEPWGELELPSPD